MQEKLFEVPETPPVLPGVTCRHCKHVIRNYWNKNLKYCNKQETNRKPDPGYKKIKSGDPACNLYEDKRKEDDN